MSLLKKSLVIVGLLALQGSLHAAVCSFYRLQKTVTKPDGTQVPLIVHLIGDAHADDTLDPRDIHRTIFAQQLATWDQPTSALTIAVESTPTAENPVNLIQYMVKHLKKTPSNHYKICDGRQGLIGLTAAQNIEFALENFLIALLQKNNYRNVAVPRCQQGLGNWQQRISSLLADTRLSQQFYNTEAFKKECEGYKTQPVATIKTLKEEVRSALIAAKVLAKKFDTQNTTLFADLAATIESHQHAMLDELARCNLDDTDLCLTFTGILLLKNQTFHDDIDFFLEDGYPWFYRLSDDTCEMSLLNQVMLLEKHTAAHELVIFAGAVHILALKHYMENGMGYSTSTSFDAPIAQQFALPLSDVHANTYMDNAFNNAKQLVAHPKPLAQFLAEIDTFSARTQGASTPTASTSTSTAPEIIHTCTTCGKIAPDMMHCSRCKEVYYCNRDCQRNNWKEHKTACVEKK